MTNYKERLDKILSKTPCVQCDGSGAYPDYDGEPAQCQFCWQLRFTFIDEAKQAITSLIKELIAEAKPEMKPYENSHEWYNASRKLDEFEQNLLKELDEV